MNGEFIEPSSRRGKERARKTSLIIHALADRFTGEPFPARSDHFKHDETPGVIGAVVFRPYEASPTVIPDTREGMDMQGNWHIKTEMNRWDDMGTMDYDGGPEAA